MSITKDQAKTDAEAANTTLTSEADQRFIDAADAQIQEAIDQGLFYINCQTYDVKVNPKNIFEYYSGLGYGVSFPDYPTNLMLQPAQLFGEFWINFWSNSLVPTSLKTPVRFLISWNP